MASCCTKAGSSTSSSYSAVFLTKEAQAELLKAFPAVHPSVFADHVTLCFCPPAEHVACLELGKVVEIEVTGVASNRYGQAVTVVLPSDVSSTNKQWVLSGLKSVLMCTL